MDRPKTKKAKILHLREFLEGNRILPGMDLECTLFFYDDTVLDTDAFYDAILLDAFTDARLLSGKC
jgi:hypothetical protein